jgi:hypothetical protein
VAEDHKPLALLGFGLVAVAGYELLKTKSATAPGTTTCPAGSHLVNGICVADTVPAPVGNFSQWLGSCRGDIVQGLLDGRYRDVIGEYAREDGSGFFDRPDIAAASARGDWNGAVGQRLREVAPAFMARSDIVQAQVAGSWGDIFGQFCKENGANACVSSFPNPTQGNAGGGRAGQGPAGGPGTGVSGLPQTGGKQAISRWQDVVAGWIVSTSCRVGVADYLIEPAGIGLDLLPYGYEPAHRRKRWIVDNLTWSRLGIPRSAIHVVTPACLASIAPGPDLRWALTHIGTGAWTEAPRILANPANAGYC